MTAAESPWPSHRDDSEPPADMVKCGSNPCGPQTKKRVMGEDLLRGADIVARTLERLGVTHVFALSGNHIMPIFDALLSTRIEITHVRHEAACVHMADAWAG